MASFTKPQKLFVIERLACYDSPSEVAKAFAEVFDHEPSRQQIETYDATKPRNRGRMSADLIELFESTRASFLDDVSQVPIANRAVRIRELQKMVDAQKTKAHPDQRLVASLLEQAAKEEGGMFTNRREHTGKDGGPIDFRLFDEATDDELDRLLQEAKGG
jgi:hypothetical protein